MSEHSCDSGIRVLNYCHPCDKFVSTHLSLPGHSLLANKIFVAYKKNTAETPTVLCTLLPSWILIKIAFNKDSTHAGRGGALQHRPGWLGGGTVGHNAFGPTKNRPVCSPILTKISKIGATGSQILRLKFAKFAFLPQTPLGSLIITALPQTL